MHSERSRRPPGSNCSHPVCARGSVRCARRARGGSGGWGGGAHRAGGSCLPQLLSLGLQQHAPPTTHPHHPVTQAGVCTECGVCDDGEAFGENVVHPPPPIPPFEGHYRPNATRAQRLRFRWGLAGGVEEGRAAAAGVGGGGGMGMRPWCNRIPCSHSRMCVHVLHRETMSCLWILWT